jgi:hypothetical protein
MLINLSNHPVENWGQKQLSEARKLYGKVVDIAFPYIDPLANETEVGNSAKEYFDKCIELLSKSSDERNAVHLMGELTFVFSLAQMLLYEGVEVIASTTERRVKEINNKKISEFNFVRFRKYLLINKKGKSKNA